MLHKHIVFIRIIILEAFIKVIDANWPSTLSTSCMSPTHGHSTTIESNHVQWKPADGDKQPGLAQ